MSTLTVVCGRGVTCDAFGHVIGLDLSYKNISGSFDSIFDLHHIQHLNLAGNNFNTTLLSYGFDKLPNLTHLNLSISCFHGQIPVKISFSTRLVSLDLSNQDDCYRRYYHFLDPHNGIYDYDPLPYELQRPLKLENPDFKTLIKNLRNLTELNLDGVDISFHSIKWCKTTSLVLSKLQVLGMSNCGLKGPLCSSLSKLAFLSKLFLGGNPISSLPPNFLEISSRLVSLSLANCGLSGYFPIEILLLPKIQSIDLSANYDLMGELPEFPSNSALRNLSLSETYFGGKVPESIGNNLSGLIPPFHRFGVPNLAYLHLGGNRLSGSISPIPKFILQLPRLEWLFLGGNSFSSMKLSSFVQLKNLRDLDLSDISLLVESNNISINFPQLESLWVSSCNLTEVPGFFKTQDKLVELDLSNNHIHGVVPNWLWKSTLQLLQLSFNPIDFSKQLPLSDANFSFPMLRELYMGSCNISAFPEFLRSQEKLQVLDLSNNRISGAIPNWATLLRPICDMSQLSTFDASHNNLSGPIPNCLGNMRALRYLDLHENNFSGTLPDFAKSPDLGLLKVSDNRLEGKLPRSLAECTQLGVLDVGNNMLRDTFPFWLKKLPMLTVLVLRENRFYGQIKHFKNKIVFPTLDVLDIASNEFSGELPVDFFPASQLRSLKIGGNKFEGKLPRSLATCSKLEVLDLRNNMVHDTFPIWLMKLPSLKVLILRENRFDGTIEDSETGHDFQNLRILDIASNNFSGDFSIEFLQCLKAMMQMSNGNKAELEYIGGDYNGGEYYEDSVTIVNKGIEIFYQKVLTIFTCLDISNNCFHGRISEQIQILRSLKVLNLSHNSFSGEIPSALDNLKDLESLDLSMNNLSGKIPPQLTGLTFLAALNLSYNQLEGSIPQSNQFNTFSNNSFIGNPKLCGPPLSRKCNEVGLPMSPPPREEEEDSWLDAMSTWQIALTSYGSGLVAGICIGFTVLNELGNKWVYKFQKYGNRSKRKFIFENQP
ncbi:Detected protein of unknown function [Hibiscus syriacus]|uniref:Uncharacterized protein n=2 Tax=Hibiscus syriacus TaxID=106335 RepID=A0A6A3AEK3_HIBSY|nr:Detected protein of unknown function [Hibiscus syriacus]